MIRIRQAALARLAPLPPPRKGEAALGWLVLAVLVLFASGLGAMLALAYLR